MDLEQNMGPAIAISHVSVLQVLVSYFRGAPIADCPNVEIPMHTVFKFVPLRGGGWLESQHVLLPDDATEPEIGPNSFPIWGDSRSCLPSTLE